MNNELEIIARKYIEKAEQSFQFILELLNVKDKYEISQLVREREDTSFLIEGKKYIIGTHGRGCFFSDGKDEIDWDFGDNQICGVDCWKLSGYIKTYHPELAQIWSYLEIKKEFEDAVNARKMEQRHELYYFNQ